MKYFPIVFNNASEHVINACRGFGSLMGIYEYEVFTNFAALKMKKHSIRNIGSEKGHQFVLKIIFLSELSKRGNTKQ